MRTQPIMQSERLAFKTFYSKADLSVMYFQRSVKNFVAEIKLFQEKLEKIGYTQHQKLFTLKQVELIFEHLGQPERSKYVSNLVYVDEKRIEIKTYRKSALRDIYFLEKKAFNRVIEEYLPNNFAKSSSHFYSKPQVEQIFDKIGQPFANYELEK